MWIVLGAVGLLVLSGLAALIVNKSPRSTTIISVGSVVVASCAGLIPVVRELIDGKVLSFSVPLAIPFGSFSVALDPLSAFFLLPILFLSALAAVYGAGYLKPWHGKKAIGVSWFFYNMLVASMVMVVIARNAVLFLIAWEMMSVASYFLVTFEDEKASVRKAGLLYLIASQVGTTFLLVLFILLGQGSGSLDFNHFQVQGSILPSVIFLLALIGFGIKAGFMPLHIWLPEAHPAAPSHVSALMSGVMIKTGIYGLVRILTSLGLPPAWWGWCLIAVGMISGFFGILFALAQHDLKRLLAYSSVENMGIIALGLGLGLLGMSLHSPVLMILGWTGGLLHVLNHAFFKGLLFLGAGAVLHGTGTREVDRLGGLLKRMPSTGICFLVGAVAICGLPPLNGFVSEFLIYLGAFHGIGIGVSVFLGALGIITALAVIGTLAAACFTKTFGIIFLGEPRTATGHDAHEAGKLMQVPMFILAAGCLVLGLLAPYVVQVFVRILPMVTQLPENVVQAHLQQAAGPLLVILQAGLALLGFLGIMLVFRRRIIGGRIVAAAGTWDCGYALPTPRMQYTSSSFSQPLTDFFSMFIRRRRHMVRPEGTFPASSSFSTETPDLFQQDVLHPVLERFYSSALRLRFFQHGRLQFYILYIIVTLLALFIWKLW